nr:phage major tail tube protein [Escherichia coli]
MTVKAKRFRIGVEGATTDGREIQREWLEQMAASYNPAVYTALINLEHIKSYLPDSTFNRYGKVTALFAEEIKEGPLAGKMALYADVEPTESLVELVKKGQKLFTSMEVSPKFADTGKAYLVGLAATDDPASLGTEMLTFSASAAHNPLANRKQNPANLFTAAEETVIELEEVQDDNLFNDGNNWQGIVESLTLPKFTRKYEKYRGGGMPGAVDVDLGLDDSALDTEFSIGGTELLLFKQMGKATVDGIQLRFTGSIQRDDTGEVQAVELVVRGRHKEVDSGEWKTGESNTTKVTSTNSYAKLTINGEVLYEVDLINMVEIVDGVDLMEAHRNALGL